jgi:hypothetical protein
MEIMPNMEISHVLWSTTTKWATQTSLEESSFTCFWREISCLPTMSSLTSPQRIVHIPLSWRNGIVTTQSLDTNEKKIVITRTSKFWHLGTQIPHYLTLLSQDLPAISHCLLTQYMPTKDLLIPTWVVHGKLTNLRNLTIGKSFSILIYISQYFKPEITKHKVLFIAVAFIPGLE